jgi:hypothetical protein
LEIPLVAWTPIFCSELLPETAVGIADETSPWISNIFLSIKDNAYYRLARPFPYPIFECMRKLQPQNLKNKRAEEFAFASQKARERMNQGGTDRVDFSKYFREVESYSCCPIGLSYSRRATWLA